MTRQEREALAEEMAEVLVPAGSTQFEAKWAREYIHRALDRACTPSRIEAAERAVVEAAVTFADALGGRRVVTSKDADVWWMLQETVSRLRDLRANAEAEECRDIGWAKTHKDEAIGPETPRAKHTVYCHLPRGHEGKHSGPLGEWVWE